MRIKICGITRPDQGIAIAQAGASALGFICVAASPRYLPPEQIRAIVEQVRRTRESAIAPLDFIGVFADAPLEQIIDIAKIATLTGIQLHGQESPEDCFRLRQHLPHLELIKAFRVKSVEVLHHTHAYADWVDTFLLDAYHPHQLGGTGQVLPWPALRSFHPQRPWLLAGGLTPANVREALAQIAPNGIDLSSGVERSPGDKDLTKVAELFRQLQM